MERKQASNQLIHRAVDLWCQMISDPSFYNGDESDNGAACLSLSEINHARRMEAVADVPAAIEKFRDVLTRTLIDMRDREGEPMSAAELEACYGSKTFEHRPAVRLPNFLSTDYGPDLVLAQAAERAGLPNSIFGYKRDVSIDRYRNCVSVSDGYATQNVNHYPLDEEELGGRWLVTTIMGDGEDLEKVKAAALSGAIDLTIEQGRKA